jgi:exodeoxyribonuclease V alpha subunit
VTSALPLLHRLDEARDLGLLRALDVELARFVAEHAGAPSAEPAAIQSPDSLLLATALLSRVESLGHACLDLRELHRDAAAVLAWPLERMGALESDIAGLPRDGAAMRAAWSGVRHVVGEGATADPQTPLVLDGDRLYLRRYCLLERRVAAQFRQRALQRPEAGDSHFQAQAALWLDKLFEPRPPAQTTPQKPAGVDLQRQACARALEAGLTIITGGPGTGKTYTAARLLVALQAMHTGPQALHIGLAAPTGKAAARLRVAIDQGLQQLRQTVEIDELLGQAAPLASASTLHALLGAQPGTRRFAHHARNPLAVDVLLVDEASMVHLELFDALLQALKPEARLVLLGDSEQLASVEAGSVLGDLCKASPGSAIADQTVKLLESRRFAGTIGQAARAANAGDAPALLSLLARPPDASLLRVNLQTASALSGEAAAAAEVARWSLMTSAAADPVLPAERFEPAGHAAWLQRLKDRPRQRELFEPWARDLIQRFDAFRVLCALREGPRGVAGINEAIEREAVARGWLQRAGTWYEGRPVMVLRNDAAQGLYNGDTGLILRAPGAAGTAAGAYRAWFVEGQTLRSVAVTRLPEVETAFAITVHKSQGSEFDQVLLVLPDEDLPVLTRELLYTGITRARRWLGIACRSDEVLARAVGRVTWRMSGLRL